MLRQLLRDVARRRRRPRSERLFTPPPTRRSALLQVEMLEGRWVPAEITVTQVKTLRDAVIEANSNAHTENLIKFDENLANTNFLTAELPPISKRLTIQGNGKTTTLVERGVGTMDGFRIFTINAGITCTITDLSIKRGLPGTNGGGIKNSGTLTLENCILSDNKAPQGGAILNEENATLSMSNCDVYANEGPLGDCKKTSVVHNTVQFHSFL